MIRASSHLMRIHDRIHSARIQAKTGANARAKSDLVEAVRELERLQWIVGRQGLESEFLASLASRNGQKNHPQVRMAASFAHAEREKAIASLGRSDSSGALAAVLVETWANAARMDRVAALDDLLAAWRGSGLLSWLFDLGVHYASEGRVPEAEHAVRKGYALCGFMDGLASIAARAHTPRMRFDEAAHLYREDDATGRLSPKAMLDYAEVLAGVFREQEAETVVEKAYASSSELVGGFSRLAWMRHGRLAFEPEIAARLIFRDIELGRFGGGTKTVALGLLAAAGQIDLALQLAEDPNGAVSGNDEAQVLWYHHALLREERSASAPRILELYYDGALSGGGLTYAAAHLAGSGDLAAARDVIRQYHRSGNAFGGHTVIALSHWLRFEDYSVFKEFFSLDLDQDRLVTFMRIAHLLFLDPMSNEALWDSHLKALRGEPAVNLLLCRSWLRRYGVPEETLKALFSSGRVSAIQDALAAKGCHDRP